MVENESWAEFVQKLTSIICDGQMWTGRLSPVWPPTSQDGQRWIFKRNPNQRPRWQGGLHLKPCGRTRLQDRQSRKLRFLWRIARTTTARNPLSRTSKRSLILRVSVDDDHGVRSCAAADTNNIHWWLLTMREPFNTRSRGRGILIIMMMMIRWCCSHLGEIVKENHFQPLSETFQDDWVLQNFPN